MERRNKTGHFWPCGSAVCLEEEEHMLKIALQHGGGSVMLWACFASSGTSRNLQCVEGKMDSLEYLEILGENVMLSVRKLKLEQHWTFQQDSDPKHTSDFDKAWLWKKS